ncbi:MAG: hypothetical protein AAFX57_19450, partial [Bacteroidota bacterium]
VPYWKDNIGKNNWPMMVKRVFDESNAKASSSVYTYFSFLCPNPSTHTGRSLFIAVEFIGIKFSLFVF